MSRTRGRSRISRARRLGRVGDAARDARARGRLGERCKAQAMSTDAASTFMNDPENRGMNGDVDRTSPREGANGESAEGKTREDAEAVGAPRRETPARRVGERVEDAGEREREDAGATVAEIGRHARRIEREEERGFVGEERDDAEDGEEESLCVSDAGEAHLEDAASDRAPRGGDRET